MSKYAENLKEKIKVREIHLANTAREVAEILERARKTREISYVEIPRWKWLKETDYRLSKLSDEEVLQKFGIAEDLHDDKKVEKRSKAKTAEGRVERKESREPTYKVRARKTERRCPHTHRNVRYEDCLRRLLLPTMEEFVQLLELAREDETVSKFILKHLQPKSDVCASKQPDCLRMWDIGEEQIMLAKFLAEHRKTFVEHLLKLDEKTKQKVLDHYEILDVARFLPGKAKRPRVQFDFQTEPLLYAKLVVLSTMKGMTMPRGTMKMLKECLKDELQPSGD